MSASVAPTFSDDEAASIRTGLLVWYRANRRRLPWRGDAPPYGSLSGAAASDAAEGPAPARSAYGTLVSEVMSQQTRVETVIKYWLEWMKTFPTVTALADATEDEVKAKWAGLGYYRRAANLLKGAQFIKEKYGGSLPSDVALLKAIPGVGDYTAGAVSSIAFDKPSPLVDGNVVRVFSRLRALAMSAKSPQLAKLCWSLASTLVAGRGESLKPVDAPGDFNQGLMELGATVCTHRSPSCHSCPLRASCSAFSEGERLVREKGAEGLLALVAAEAAGAESGSEGEHAGGDSAAAKSGAAKGASSSGSSAKKKAVAAPSAAKPKLQQASLTSFFKPVAAPASSSSSSSTAAASVDDIEDLAASASSSSSPPSSRGALSEKELAAISKWIESKYPQKAEKKQVPTVELAAFILVRSAPESASSSSSALAAAASDFSASEVWLHRKSAGDPVAKATSAKTAAKGGKEDDVVEVSDGDDNDEDKGAQVDGDIDSDDGEVGKKRPRAKAAAAGKKAAASSGSAGKWKKEASAPSKLLEGQWQPLVIPWLDLSPPPSSSSSAGAPGPSKRAKKATDKVAEGGEDDVVVISDDEVEKGDAEEGSSGVAGDASSALTTSSAALSPSALALLRERVSACVGSGAGLDSLSPTTYCGSVTHVFSHVVHKVRVYRCRLTTVPTTATTTTTTTTSAGGRGVDGGEWAKPSRFESLGLTTWAVKVLYAALSPPLSSSLANESDNDAGAGAGASLPPEEKAALAALEKRWKLAKGKVVK